MRFSTGAYAFAVAGLVACAAAALPSPRELERSDLDEMKARIVSLQETVTVAEVEIARLRKQLAVLEAQMAEVRTLVTALGPEPMPPPFAERDTIESSDLGPRVRPVPPQPSRLPAPETPAAPTSERLSGSAQGLYDEGYTLFHQGRYVDAESAFQRFLQAHRGSDLADNALYWIGEARFARGDLRGALSAFREVVERFPRGNKVADALLKNGDCLAGLGDTEEASQRYEEVESRFPQSAAAAIAAERRAALP